MENKCPKCGSAVKRKAGHYSSINLVTNEYECGTLDYPDGDSIATKQCVTNQLAVANQRIAEMESEKAQAEARVVEMMDFFQAIADGDGVSMHGSHDNEYYRDGYRHGFESASEQLSRIANEAMESATPSVDVMKLRIVEDCAAKISNALGHHESAISQVVDEYRERAKGGE